MLLSFFLVCFSAINHIHAADNINIDSIGLEISSLTDSAKVYRLISLSDGLKYNNTHQALQLAFMGLEISSQNHLDYELGLSHQGIAEIYLVRALYEKALENYLAALKIFTMLNDSSKIAECSNEAGSIFMQTKNYSQASVYFLKALEINKKLRNIREITANYNNIGNAYVLQDSIDKGLSHYLVALLIADSMKYENEVINLLNNIGSGYVRLGRYPQAISAFERASKLSIMNQNLFEEARANLGISKVYFNTFNYPRALKFGLKSNKLAQSENFNRIMHDSELLLSEIYAASGDYHKAYDHYINYKVISDSIFSNESSKQLAIMQAKYELDAKEKENQILRLRDQENKKTIERKNTIVLVTSLIILVSVILVLLLLYINKKFKRLNQKLAVQSEELKNLNQEKDRFFAYVVHNIKNPFSTILGFSELLMKHAGQKDTDKVERYSKYIYDSSVGIREILDNLLEWSRLLRGKYEYKPVRLELEALVKDIIELNNKAATKKDIIIHDENIEQKAVYADRQMVYTILQNLLSNAIKYNGKKGRVVISASEKGQMVEVVVSDTGKGISAEKLKNLFVFDPSDTEQSDEKPAGAGMGLVICKELVTKNGGTIAVESTPGKGSRFTFTLPVPREGMESTDEKVPDISGQMNAIKTELKSISNFPEELTENLKKDLLPLHTRVSKVLSVEELKEFTSMVISLAEKHQIKPLKDYGQLLLKQTELLQFDKILKILPEFTEITNIILY
jgi:signal transduction histidine kinase